MIRHSLLLILTTAWVSNAFAQEPTPVAPSPDVPTPVADSVAEDPADDAAKTAAESSASSEITVTPGPSTYYPYYNYGANYYMPAYTPGYIYPTYNYTPISPIAYPVYGYYSTSPAWGSREYTYGGYYTVNTVYGGGWYVSYGTPIYMGW